MLYIWIEVIVVDQCKLLRLYDIQNENKIEIVLKIFPLKESLQLINNISQIKGIVVIVGCIEYKFLYLGARVNFYVHLLEGEIVSIRTSL